MIMDRGRNSGTAKNIRVRYNTLDALVRASNAWRLGEYSTCEREAQRTVIGLLRMASRHGANVGELTGATGLPRQWVRSQLHTVR